MTNGADTQSRLERAIHAANRESVLSILRELEPFARAKLRKFVLRLGKLTKDSGDLDKRAVATWGKPASAGQHEAALSAVIVCGTAEDVARVFRWSSFPLLDVVREFRPPSTQDLGDALVQVSPHHLGVVQQLVVEGLIERPTTDAYLVAVIGLHAGKSDESIRLGAGDWLERDAGFAQVILRMLEIEGVDGLNLAATDRSRLGWGKPTWSAYLRELVERGVYSREIMLDRVLNALSKGWTPFRAQWFSAFHGSLNFSTAEMAPHAPRYLSLITSNSPATVSFALDAVKSIDDVRPFDARTLLDGVTPALSSPARTHVEVALRIVDGAVARDPALAADAGARIAAALLHESADVQGQVLKRLAVWTLNAETRALLAQSATTIAAIHRATVANLAGPAQTAQPSARASPAPPTAWSPLDPAVRISPVASGEELVECVTYFLANEADIDELERAIDGLVRLAPLDNATRARLEPLAALPSHGWVPPVSSALRIFMQFVLTGRPSHEGWTYGHYQYLSPVHLQLCQRLDELMEFCHRHARCAPLSTPTHARGFIDPAVLVERLAVYRTRGVRPGPWDAMLAILRLAPLANPAAIAAARALGDDTMAHAVRFALGDDIVVAEPELRGAAARIRMQHVQGAARPEYGWRVVENFDCPDLMCDIEIVPLAEPLFCDPLPPDESTRIPMPNHRPPAYADFAGLEPSLIHYFASLLPSDPEGLFAYRALKKTNREHLAESEKETRGYLLPLLHATTVGPMGRLLIAVSIASDESSHVKLAVDALLRAHALERIDVPRMSEELRILIGSQLVSAGRLVRSLKEVYGNEPHAAAILLELLGAIVAAAPAARFPVAPRDMTAALVLMTEMVLSRSLAVPAHLCAALAEARLGTKAAALRKQLLARAAV